MDGEQLYDEFGNYIGPDLDSDGGSVRVSWLSSIVPFSELTFPSQDDGAYAADDWAAAAEQAEVQAGLVGEENATGGAIIPHGQFSGTSRGAVAENQIRRPFCRV